jgi:hypothetical protein
VTDEHGVPRYYGDVSGITVYGSDPGSVVGPVLLQATSETTIAVLDGFGDQVGAITLERLNSALEVRVDIKPGSDENPLNVGAQGLLPVAVAGKAPFDPRAIDLLSLRLAGVAPVRTAVADAIGADAAAADGNVDLVLWFDVPELARALGAVKDGAALTLTLAGEFVGGGAIQGSDRVRIINKQPAKSPRLGR